MVTWDKITVGQFQAIYKVANDKDMDEVDKACSLISLLYNMTLKDVDELTEKEFNHLSALSTAKLNIEDMPGRPVKVMKVGRRKYGINYRINSMRHRQYVEVQHFGTAPIENMHLIMASIVQPIRWGRWLKNESTMHVEIAADLLNARLIDVYHSCVFFCKVYLSSIKSIRPYLVKEMTARGMTEETADELLTLSQNIMAGHIPQTA